MITDELSKFTVKYKYTGPRDSKNRDFCRALLNLNKVYTRAEIDKISSIVDRNVWTKRGGWQTVKGTDIHLPFCRHQWSSVLVKNKNSDKVILPESTIKRVNNLANETAKEAEKIHKGDVQGYDRFVYKDLDGINSGNAQKTVAQLKEEMGDYISTEKIYNNPNVIMPQNIKYYIQDLGKTKVDDLINNKLTEKINISDINIIQEYVFENPLLKAIANKNNKVVLFKYKDKYYLNDGNHRVAAAKLNNAKNIDAVVVNVD
jgi:hypothetical protein